MARKQYERVTVIGSYASKNTALFNQVYTDYVPAGGVFEVEVYAPAGTVAKTNLIRAMYNAYGVAGAQNKRIAILTNERAIGILIGYGDIANSIEYTYGQWMNVTAGSNTRPADAGAQYLAQKDVVFTDADPIVFQFNNLATSTSDASVEKTIAVRYEFERVVNQ